MKQRCSNSPALLKAAGTVSAAALMLGVSQAATIGFNFQTHYCGADSYSGAGVTAPAFGIGTNSWESLTPMDTGYNGCEIGPFTVNETIDTTTSTDGLNPLPAGSLNLSWTGYVANVSGFGGYSRSGPHYTYGGNGHHPGEEEVYWGFIRDGVNFGPGSSGGDNNQPGYSIDITGLKSVFPTNPFVIQLIAASDSLDTLADAFIIDAAKSSTQTVSYPNIAPVNNSGDTPWTRGVGGGLSTGSGSVDADHIQIVGDRASHSEGPPAYNHASTIAGFIITDKPVVTMPPQSVTVGKGDSLTLRAIAIGVPPLALQWRKGGVPIQDATNATYQISSIVGTDDGTYDLVATNLYGSATSKPSVVSVDHLTIVPRPFVVDSKPLGTAIDGADFGATWLASSKDGANVTRPGVMSFSAAAKSQITLPASDALAPASGTIAFWVRTGTTNVGTGNEGAILFDHRTGSGMIIAKEDDGTILAQPNGSGNSVTSAKSVADNRWHHVAVVYDVSDVGGVAIYIDGVLDNSNANSSAWSWPAGQEIELGSSHDAYWRSYDGLLDDVRIYDRQLSDVELALVVAGDALVDSTSLQVRLNFDAEPVAGISVNWMLSGDTLQSADVVTGPYTDVAGATSPYSVPATAAQKYYRFQHTTGTVVSNPYDM
ncbi:MAG TPA: LamG-like jellyroll fold domain-containing protein [Candidatus Limnocylindria bacterium]|nr:LamG-like jellyroll fold domain-containing protein [Candidatus Limnocylindria bacterium]